MYMEINQEIIEPLIFVCGVNCREVYMYFSFKTDIINSIKQYGQYNKI